jgi:hypothetical protein
MAQIGICKFAVNGRWDLDDLSVFPRELKQVYAFHSTLSAENVVPFSKLSTIKAPPPLRGGFSYVNLYNSLYNQIPMSERPYIYRFSYSSPGFLEIMGTLAVLNALIYVVKNFLSLAQKVLDIIRDSEDFLNERRLRRRETRQSEVEFSASEINEAKYLAHIVGKEIGFSEHDVEMLQSFTGNWVGTLKLIRPS